MKYTEFTDKDFELINKAWSVFADYARERCSNDKEFGVVRKAFEFANEAHKNVRRRSGEPYILHPIEVAQIVVKEIGLGYKSMTAALLHDVVEDTEYTVDDIRALFGNKVASLVDGLTKIKTVLDNEDRTKMTDIETKSLQAENFKRILLTLNDDVRVVLIKLADRLHNCRTIEFMPEHKRDKILSETMYVFIPLAHRLGFYSIKSEMENIWLRFKEPDDYSKIKSLTEQNVASTSTLIDDFIAPIDKALKADGYKYEIKKRVKTPYSIWHKMKTKHVTFDQIFDLYAVRIIFEPQTDDPVKERKMCYDIYSTITSIYRFQSDRLRDWIKSPKSNGYEALHCTLMSEGGNWVEVQIRSKRMDDIAEKGIAAHWAYKKDGYISENDSEMDKWLAKVQDIIKSPDLSSLELLDMIHKDLVTSEIVVFTPKGHQRSIAVGSTALDFAYQIHTDIGDHAIAAKVNMKLCTLSQQLHQGDLVEIITARNACPKLEWLGFLQTRHARRRVLDYLKEHCPEDFAKAEKMQNDTPKMAENVILCGGQRYVVASCCCPIPGDPVIGFKRADGTIMIHKKTCPQIQTLGSTHGDKLVVPDWHFDGQQKNFPVTLTLSGLDRMGLLNEITQQISLSLGINMHKLVLEVNEGIFQGSIELFVDERATLEKLITCIRTIDGIQTVARTEA